MKSVRSSNNAFSSSATDVLRPVDATRRVKCAGFSLVESAVALGVVSFGFVALVGMIPVGLDSFHGAVDATVGSQIAQSVLREARQARFSELANLNRNPDADPAKPTADYFFNEEGTVTPTTTQENHVYHAAVQVSYADQFEVGDSPTDLAGDPESAHLAVVHVVVRRISAPNQSREFTGYIANNGL